MPIETDVGMTFEPIEIQEPTYEEVEIEIAEIEIAEIEIELEIETEIEATEEMLLSKYLQRKKERNSNRIVLQSTVEQFVTQYFICFNNHLR